ncbi:MAG: DMT family transporter [Flavobacteriales bacterium]|nr:DMT family transporter [Flavobacteriales bacterium]
MLDILYTIIAFNVLIILFKFFDKLGIDNLQALIVNYFVAGFCGLFFSGQEFSLQYVLQADWIYHAAVIGILFVVTFNLYAIGTQKVGIAITTIANKLSLFVPVGMALIIYPGEQLTWVKVVGFILAVIGIYLSSTKKKKLSFDKSFLWLIILVFIGQGIADTVFNHAQRTVVNDTDKGLFFMCLLFIAGISGVLILLGKSIRKKPRIKLKSLLGGLIFGLPNFASLIFFFNALESSGLEASQVFPVVSMGVVIGSALVGLLLFKEKLSGANWLGLLFAVLSIFMITFIR